jgi:hypothetical protein
MVSATKGTRSKAHVTSPATNLPSSSVYPAPAATGAVAGPRRSMLTDAWQYQVDFWQRSVLFLDTLRERGDNMLAHEEAGLPPLLKFKYDTILDARQFEHPANYALLKIDPAGDACFENCAKKGARPVIVFDPRAGHGPGIGGFKRDSEVGMALHDGHPVYFVVFFPDPCPGQDLADVHHALRRFVTEVGRRHPGQPPVLYGNCQAGWAVVLLSADCVGTAGPAVLNGSPLSYWAGEAGVNPMRLAAGLTGGAWATHLMADLAGSQFDGAWLAQNFENLNPANTLWDKNYQLFANVDEERERFLDFERWWGGYYRMSREEILDIVENLFIGNKLEQGEFRICEHCVADLKRIRNPLLIFASSGDNITPPHQALKWISSIYPTTEALKAAGQRIVYLLNPHVGHLGIFVSASVARLEHRAILEHVNELESLKPGLYEMKILATTGDPDCANPQYSVKFEPRRVEDIRYEYPQRAFEKVRELSEFNESAYRTFVSPWVRSMSTPWTTELQKWLHPMRVSRYAYSERVNPAMAPFKGLAKTVMASREPVPKDNPYRAMEMSTSQAISRALESYRKTRDQACESLFGAMFGLHRAAAVRAIGSKMTACNLAVRLPSCDEADTAASELTHARAGSRLHRDDHGIERG